MIWGRTENEKYTHPKVFVRIIPGKSMSVRFGAPVAAIFTIILSREKPPARRGSISDSDLFLIELSSSGILLTGIGVGLTDVEISAVQNLSSFE